MYIYDQPNWPNFTFNGTALTQALGTVRYKQGKLLGRLADWGFDPLLKINADTLVTEVLSNGLIEGEELPANEVRSSVATRLGLPTAGLQTPSHHVDGVVEMMLDATTSAHEPVTEQRLGAWQATLFPTGRSGLRAVQVGQYRDHPDSDPMQVISGALGRTNIHFEAPSSRRVPKMMNELLRYIEDDQPTDPIIKAGVVHLWFLTIHPFDDGNGRIARALTDLLLTRADGGSQRFYSLSNAILTNRKYYYRQLEHTQKGSLDITNWLQWFLDIVDKAIQLTEEQLHLVFNKARFWHKHRELKFNQRQQLVLDKVLDGYQGKLTSFRYANITAVSHDTATRDINDLVGKGILRAGPAGGRSTAYILVDDQR